jgi:hypothetical protein
MKKFPAMRFVLFFKNEYKISNFFSKKEKYLDKTKKKEDIV